MKRITYYISSDGRCMLTIATVPSIAQKVSFLSKLLIIGNIPIDIDLPMFTSCSFDLNVYLLISHAFTLELTSIVIYLDFHSAKRAS